jgi:hypothetical protein
MAHGIMTDRKPECEVEADVPRNLIHVRYRGDVAAAQMKACSESVRKLLPQMRQGFIFLTDLSGLGSMQLDCVPELTKLMDACKARGIGTVVRIVPDPRRDIGFNILSIVHYRRGVRVVTCQNAAEAEQITGIGGSGAAAAKKPA